MKILSVIVGVLRTNCYILFNDNLKAVIVDPGDEHKKIKEQIVKHNLDAKAIILTHGHYDHIGSIDQFDLPVYINAADKDFLDYGYKNRLSADLDLRILNKEGVPRIADMELEVIHTPGHTLGSICIKLDEVLLSGDTLFFQGIGRTDLPGGNYDMIIDSIYNKLFTLDENIKVYPGHGPVTTISKEKGENPFL